MYRICDFVFYPRPEIMYKPNKRSRALVQLTAIDSGTERRDRIILHTIFSVLLDWSDFRRVGVGKKVGVCVI